MIIPIPPKGLTRLGPCPGPDSQAVHEEGKFGVSFSGGAVVDSTIDTLVEIGGGSVKRGGDPELHIWISRVIVACLERRLASLKHLHQGLSLLSCTKH